MKIRIILSLLSATLILLPVSGQKKGGVSFVKKEAEKKIEVMINGKHFTTYYFPDNVAKPILFPIKTPAGTIITRGYPIEPRANETVDHPHHNGSWLNYGDVSGYNFWGNLGTNPKDPKTGSIRHQNFEKISDGKKEGVLVYNASWVTDSAKKELLKERTEYHFIEAGKVWIIDRITKLTANNEPVVMNDTKEGMFGMRVARELELPSKSAVTITGPDGKSTGKREVNNKGVSGDYRSSEGVTGEAVWSTRAKWMDLYGAIGNEKISIVICDHPKNPSYPTYWHARGYGLFTLNPFGAKDFTKGKEVLNYTIEPGKSTTMRYRIIVSSGAHLSDAEINRYSDEFSKMYLN